MIHERRPFKDLLIEGNFGSIAHVYEEQCDSGWITKGNLVRGKLVLLELGAVFDLTDLEFEMLRLNVQAATAYELTYFASHGWNGEDDVLAFGSTYFGRIPWLRIGDGLSAYDWRELSCQYLRGPWLDSKVLCIKI